MAGRIGRHDWAATPLGSIGSWPESLRAAVDMMLAMPGPATIIWGPEDIQLYNDAYISIAKDRHPDLLGRPVAEGWPDVYDKVVAPLIAAARAGQATTLRNFAVELRGPDGAWEERVFDTVWSRIHAGTGAAGILQTLAEVTERRRAEQALRASEARYRTLFDSMGQGYCELELIRDAEGRAVDQLYLELNPAFERLIGIPVTEAKGRKASEVLPQLEPRWHVAFDRVVRSGLPERIEYEVASLGRWFEVFAYPAGGDRLTVLYVDVTDRKQAEDVLRESEERQAFLLKFSDALRAEPNSDAVAERAIRMLADQMRLDRCYITVYRVEEDRADFTHQVGNDKVPPLPGSVRLSDFPDAFQQVLDRTVVIEDDFERRGLSDAEKKNSQRLGMRALLASTLRKGENDPLSSMAAVSGTPRHWTRSEIALVEEVAERTWAAIERARTEQALRESEERFRALVTAGTYSIYRMSPDWRIMYQLDSRTLAVTAEPSENWADGYILPEDRPHVFAAIEEAIRTKSLFELEHRVRLADNSIGWVLSRAVPLFGGDGEIAEWFGAASEVTERKRAEEKLRDIENRGRAELERQVLEQTAELKKNRDLLQAIIDSSTDMIQVFEAIRDENGEIVDFNWVLNNHTSESRYGKVEGESLLQRNPGVLVEGIFDTFKRVTETRQPEQTERHYVHEQFDGWFIQSIVNLNDGVATTTKDITDWKAAQEEMLHLQEEVAQSKLRESEERYRLIVENASDYAIVITDPDDTESVFGWSAEEAIGRPAEIVFTPEDQALGEPEKELATARGEGSAPDVRWHQRKDGSLVFIEGTVTPLRNGEGGIRGYLKIGQDVTERRRAEEALEASEQRMRTLATGIPQLVFRSASNGWRTWGSPQWIAFTGRTFEESIGFGWLEAVHPDDREATRSTWDGVEERGEYYCEHPIRDVATGEYRWHQTRATPLRDDQGNILEWLGTSTDVEELRRLQRHQQLLMAELQHRVRNTLGVVRSIVRRTAEMSSDVADMASHLQGRLAAFSRVQSAVTRVPDGGVHLAGLIEDELVAHAAREGERVSVEGPDIALKPRAAESLSLAIHELTSNAVKYGALGADRGWLAIAWRREERDGRAWLRFEWIERGLGHPLETPARRGFGLELLDRSLPYELGATTDIAFAPEGFRFTMDMPLGQHLVGGGVRFAR